MKIEELTEKMNDTEAVLTQQGKRIKDLESKEVKMDYTAEFMAVQDEIKNISSKFNLDQLKEMFEKLSKAQPIGRMAEPEEIANLAG